MRVPCLVVRVDARGLDLPVHARVVDFFGCLDRSLELLETSVDGGDHHVLHLERDAGMRRVHVPGACGHTYDPVLGLELGRHGWTSWFVWLFSRQAGGILERSWCARGSLAGSAPARVRQVLPAFLDQPRRKYRCRRERRRGWVSRQSSYVLNVPAFRAVSTHSVCACRLWLASFSGAITTCSLIACSLRPHSGHVYVAGF